MSIGLAIFISAQLLFALFIIRMNRHIDRVADFRVDLIDKAECREDFCFALEFCKAITYNKMCSTWWKSPEKMYEEYFKKHKLTNKHENIPTAR